MSLVPNHEPERLAALHGLRLLDTEPEARFERIVRLGRQLLGVPRAAIGLLDADRLWFKAQSGGDDVSLPRALAFCEGPVAGGAPCAIEDLAHDPRFAAHPLVVAGPRLRAYLGLPLVAPGGQRVGALAFLDTAPRAWSAQDLAAAADLAAMAEAELAAGEASALMQRLHESEAAQRRGHELGRAVLGSSLDAILTVDEDGLIGEFNAAAERIFRIAAGAVRGRPMNEVILPQALRAARLLAPGERGFGRRLEVPARRADGTEFPAEIAITPFELDGRPHVAATIRDLTARRRVETELARHRERTEEQAHLLDLVPAGVMGLDFATRRLTYWNQGAVALYGWQAGEVLGHSVDEVLRSILPGGRADVLATLATTGHWAGMVVHHHRQGHVVAVDTRWVLRRDAAGKPLSVLEIATDATERLRVEGELVRAKSIAEQANGAKSLFLANMSHELRTPLNAIIGYSELIRDELAEDGHMAHQQDLRRIGEAGRHLLHMIDGVLDLSKIEAGKMALDLAETSLEELLGELAELMKPLAAQRGNRVELDVQKPLPPIWTDPTKLRQVVYNLLANANKFTDVGVIALSAALVGGDMLRIRVTDTGIGMSAQQAGRLFQEFVQADPSITRRHGGTGLGLAISRRFCEMLGGTIAVESALGLGSTFEVRLPIRGADELPPELATVRPPFTADPGRALMRPPSSPRRLSARPEPI